MWSLPGIQGESSAEATENTEGTAGDVPDQKNRSADDADGRRWRDRSIIKYLLNESASICVICGSILLVPRQLLRIILKVDRGIDLRLVPRIRRSGLLRIASPVDTGNLRRTSIGGHTPLG
jgi:hypothetical protein